jgi:hypothetical protein
MSRLYKLPSGHFAIRSNGDQRLKKTDSLSAIQSKKAEKRAIETVAPGPARNSRIALHSRSVLVVAKASVWHEVFPATGSPVTTGIGDAPVSVVAMRTTKKINSPDTRRKRRRVRRFLACLPETEFVPVHTRSEVTEIRPKSSPAGHAFIFSFA